MERSVDFISFISFRLTWSAHIALCTRVLLADRPIAASRTGKRRPCSQVGRISGCRSGPRASLQGRPTTLAWPSLLRSSRCPPLPPKADIERHDGHVRLVPKPDLRTAAKKAAIREPSARKRRVAQSPHDQRRYTTVGEYLIRLAAEQQSRDAAPAMRRHDNQIAPLLFSSGDDTFGRMLILHVDNIAGHAVCFSTLGSAIEDAIGRRCRHLFKMTNWIRPMLPRFVGHVQGRPWLRHRDNSDVCIVTLGEGKPMFKSLRRQFRAVGCNQDMLVHR